MVPYTLLIKTGTIFYPTLTLVDLAADNIGFLDPQASTDNIHKCPQMILKCLHTILGDFPNFTDLKYQPKVLNMFKIKILVLWTLSGNSAPQGNQVAFTLCPIHLCE